MYQNKVVVNNRETETMMVDGEKKDQIPIKKEDND